MKTRILLASDTHWCHLAWYGMENRARLDKFAADIEAEAENSPVDALLFLGDYSLDHWKWGIKGCYLNEGIRNPQTAQLDGIYILHGRNAALTGFVFYTSKDGQNWDEGTDLGHERGSCYYSNNIVLQDKAGNNRLLVQYSEMYGIGMCVNVKHVWLTVEK